MTTHRLEFFCPDIKNQEDAYMIGEMLHDIAGVGEVKVDWRTKQVIVVTSSQDKGQSVVDAMLKSAYPPVDPR